MKYLVLGSAGQIGLALVNKIRDEKLGEVIEFDIETSVNQDLRIYKNSILEEAIKKCDFIFFLAFDVGGSRYLKAYQNTFDFISNNTKILANTFEIIKKYDRPFIFASSQMSNMGFSTYGRLKGIGEAYTNTLGGLVVKFWNVYGVEYDLNKSHVITDLIIKAKNTKEIDLITDGKEERQFLYADDCCDCLLTLSEKYNEVPRHEELHISSFKWHSILDIADIISKHYKGSKIIPSKSFDTVQHDQRNEPNKYVLKYWQPKTDVETGIKKIIKEMEKKPEVFFNKKDKENILVSTITPCFRMKRYLKKFLDELPKQTFFNKIEIVLDHNEPDEEEIKWVKDFQNKYPGRIKHIIVPKVDPLGISMNRCMKEASGKYLTIWNVDDLRTPNSIEIQYNMLEQDKEYGLAYGNYIVVRHFGDTEGKLIEHSNIPEIELTRSMVTGPFIFFRKDLLDKSGYFDEQLIQGPDFDLSIRLAFHTKARVTDKILGYYLNEGKGMSTKPDSPQPIERVAIELRYGIYDKIDYDLIADASKINIPFIREFGSWNHVSQYVPEYNKLISERKKMWKRKGLMKYSIKNITAYKKIYSTLKGIYKKIITV